MNRALPRGDCRHRSADTGAAIPICKGCASRSWTGRRNCG